MKVFLIDVRRKLRLIAKRLIIQVEVIPEISFELFSALFQRAGYHLVSSITKQLEMKSSGFLAKKYIFPAIFVGM